MAGDTTIRAIIKLLVEGGHIPKEVATSITGVGDASKKTKAELSSLGQTGKELGAMLTQFLGAAALGSFIKSSVTDFAALDRQFNALGFTMKKLGVGGSEDLAHARSQLEALALSGGPLQRQTIPAMQKFVTMTRDTDKALAAVKLASDVSESGVTDFGSAAAGVASLLQGRVKVAATQFGIDLTDINGKAKTNAQLIREIETAYGGLGDAFDDAANKIDTLDARWEQLKQTVGKGFAPAIGVITDALFHAMGAAKDLGEFFGFVFNGILAVARGTGRGLAAALDLKTLISDPGKYLDGLKETFTANVGDMKDAWSVFTEGLAANHSQAAGKVADTTKGLKALIQQATKATAEDDAKAAADAAQKRQEIEHKATQEALQAQISATKQGTSERLRLELALLDDQEKAEVEKATAAGAHVNKVREAFQVSRAVKVKAYAEDQVAIERELQDRLIQLEIDGATEASIEKHVLETNEINRRYLAEIEAAEKEGRSTTLIKLAYQKEISNATIQFVAARAQAEIEAQGLVIESEREARDAEFELALVGLENNVAKSYVIQNAAIDAHFQDVEDDLNAQLEANARNSQGTIAIQTTLQNKIIANEADAAAARKRLELSVTQHKQQMYLAAASTAIGALQTIFGESKAFAVASAIINTAEGITRALKDFAYPYNIYVAALIGAAGAVQIGKIMSANPGGSGSGASAGGSAQVAAQPTQSSAPPPGATAAADGAIVSRGSGPLPEGFKAQGRDTEPFMLEPGEIVTPADASKDVLAGRAVIAAGSEKGTPDAPAKPIVGGKLSLIPTKRGGPVAPPTSRSSILGDPRRPISPAKGSKPPMHAAAGIIVPPSDGAPVGIKAAIARAGAWFKTAMQPVPEDTPQRAAARGPSVQLGGAKGSSALMPQLSGAMGVAAKAAMQPQTDPVLREIRDLMAESTKQPKTSKPANVDQSITIAGNVYGGDEGMRHLSRELTRAGRRDSNRII